MDYRSLLHDPIYAIQGVSAKLTLANGYEADGLTVLDKTSGVNVGTNVEVPTILPAACVRVPELVEKGVVLEMLPDAELEMNGYVWTVGNYRFKPTPNGQDEGEILLLLSEQRKVNP